MSKRIYTHMTKTNAFDVASKIKAERKNDNKNRKKQNILHKKKRA